MTSNMTSIEEIVKYQQELLNYQRNQKQIQKETIKLLHSLNNSLALMSDRLDEFALKTNLKLDDFSPAPISSNAILVNNMAATKAAAAAAAANNNNMNNSSSSNMITTTPTTTITSGGAANSSSSSNKINYLLNNEIIYLTAGDILTTTTTGSNSSTNLINTAKLTPTSTSTGANKANDVFILNDLNSLNPSLINLDQLTTSHQATTSNKIFLINNNPTTLTSNDLIRPLIKLENATLCNGTLTTAPTTVTALTTTMPHHHHNTHHQHSTKQNTTVATMNNNHHHHHHHHNNHHNNTTNTSDESISGEMSYDESSRDDDAKETSGIGSGGVMARVTNAKKKSNKRNRDTSSLRSSVKDTEEGTNQQRLFNKFVREKVETRLGKDFLLHHEIQEINSDIMEEIRRDALEAYPPINIRPRRAWHLAKASLRCRRRSLRRQKERFVQVQTMNNSVSTTTGSTNNTSANRSANTAGTNGSVKEDSSTSQQQQQQQKILIDTCLIQPSHMANLSSV